MQDSKSKRKRDQNRRSSRKRNNRLNKSELDRTGSYDPYDRQSFQITQDNTKDLDYGQMIENQLSSIKKQIAAQPRQQVLSKHRNDQAQPRSILPRTEEAFFLRQLQEIVLIEKELEAWKIELSLREDFNMIDAFGILDEDGKGNLNPQELHVALRKNDIVATQEDCYLFFIRYNRDVDGLLKYSEFADAFMPVD